jgi:hypothetical protein
MKTAEDFLRQYAKGKPLELFIRDGGGELANNSRHIAEAMEAYKEHCTKAENLPISHVMRCSVKDIDKFYEKTGYSDNTNDWGIRKDKRNDWDFKKPSQMIKDWMKWKRNNA